MVKVRVKTAAIITLLILLGGCADKSPMRLYIQSIVGTGENTDKNYIEADLIGNIKADPCSVIQDQVIIVLNLEKAGTLGDQPKARIDGCEIQYFYYDPNDGQLKGPVANLTTNVSNIRTPVSIGLPARLLVAAVTFNCKSWSQGVTCHGVTGFAGPGTVDRMVLKFIVRGTDDTGGALTAEGNIMVYLYNYGPGPIAPSPGSTPTTSNWCYGLSSPAYWTGCF
jgi:hypothetical protein